PLACASQIVLAQRGASRPGCSPAVPRGPHRLEEERMNDVLRDRIRRNLEALPEDRLYQVLDYIEFLNSKYARQPVRQGSPFQRFGEKLEDRMRLNRIGYDAIRNTLGVVGTADRMVSGLTEAGKSIIREV